MSASGSYAGQELQQQPVDLRRALLLDPVAGARQEDLLREPWYRFLQAIERDSGAARGVSFTEGLELTLGH